MGFMYMLKSANPNGATKTYRYREDGLIERVSSYDAGHEFLTVRLPRDGAIETIDDLSEIIQSTEDEPEWFAIRGELRSRQVCVEGVNRQYLEKNDFPHWMEPVDGQNWVMVDIDGMGAPQWFLEGAGDLEMLANWTRDQLPECFRGVSFHYHYSSSAGLKRVGDELYELGFDTVRIHLWFILDRYVCSQSIRRWMKRNASASIPMDPALYNPVQPHYTADPIFEGGPDPLAGERSGLLRGERDVVTAPDAWVDAERWEQENAAQARTVRMFASFSSGAGDDEAYCMAALKSAEARILSAREGTRHDTVYSEAAAIGELVHRFDESEALRVLVSAACSVVEDSRHREMIRTVHEAMEKGKLSPRHRQVTGVQPVAKGKDLSDLKVERFRRMCEERLPQVVLSRVGELPACDQERVYRLAESYRSVGWAHPVPGPLSDLDAVITAQCVVVHDLEEGKYGCD